MPKRKSSTPILEIMGYSIPVYHEGAKSYVDFYAYDIAEGRIRRKKYHLDSLPTKRKRKEYAQKLILELTVRLQKGWRPWQIQNGTEKGYTSIEECLERYLERIRLTCRTQTLHAYNSKVNVLKDFINTLPTPPKYICELNKDLVVEFLDWLIVERKVGPRTRNNYRNWLNILGEYLIKRNYLKENPTAGTEKLKERIKHRKPLSSTMLKQVKDFLIERDKNFLLAVMLEYYAFIRPKELRLLKLKDISVARQTAMIGGEVSKNGRTASVALNDTIIRLMIDTGCLQFPVDYYLFGKDFRPSPRPCSEDAFNKRWAIVRKALKFGDEYQFYSLKDSGIRDLANSKGIVYAKRQARHTDISTTNKYLEGESMPLPEELKHFKGEID